MKNNINFIVDELLDFQTLAKVELNVGGFNPPYEKIAPTQVAV